MIDYKTWTKTLKISIKENPENYKLNTELITELTENINKSKTFLHPSPSKFLQKELYPLLPYFFQDSKLSPPFLDLLNSIIDNSSHDIEFYSEILVQMIMEIWIAGKGALKSAKKVIKTFLNKTRNFDVIWSVYVNVGLKGVIGKGYDGINEEKDFSVVKRAKGVRFLKEMLAFDSGNLLTPSKKDVVDTAFWKVRQAVEIILGYYHNSNNPISLVDASRNSLVNMMKKYDTEFLKGNLSKRDLDIFEEIEGKFVKSKYESKISKKMQNMLPEMVEAGILDPKLATISEKGFLEDGTVELENLNIDVRKVELKFGQLEFEGKNGEKLRSLDPKIFGNLNDNEEDIGSGDDEQRTNKSRRKKKKKKKRKGEKGRFVIKKRVRRKENGGGYEEISENEMEEEEQESLKNEKLKSLNPYNNNLDLNEFLPFMNYLDPAKNDIKFSSKNGLIWDFIPIDLLKETLDFSLNWTVRFLSLEKICVLVRTKANLKNDQFWGLIRYVYVMFCNGKKVSFLNKVKYLTKDNKSKSEKPKRREKLAVKRNLRRKIVVRNGKTGEEEIKDKGVFEVDREMDAQHIETNQDIMYTEYKELTPPKAKVLLLLIAEKVISYRSNLLFEPLISCLGDDHFGVRTLSFKLLSNTQKLFKTKLPALMMTYQLALRFDNVFMRVNLLNLILLMIYTSGHLYTLQKIIKPVEILTSVCQFLDSDSIKLKLTAMNCLVGICKFWPDFGAQEILREILEDQVYGFLLDRLDGGKIEIIGENYLKDQTSVNGTYLEYQQVEEDPGTKDFVKEIVEKEREFEKQYNQGKIGYQDFAKFGIKVEESGGNFNRNFPIENEQEKDNYGDKKPIAFTIDMKPPTPPKKEKNFIVKIPKGMNLEKKLKKDKLKYVNEINAEEYKKYEGVDKGLRFEGQRELNKKEKGEESKENKKLKAEEEVDNILNEYLSDLEQYDGDFNDVEEDDEGYAKYKQLYDLPKRVKEFKQIRKRRKDKAKEDYKKNLKPPKKPEPKPREIPVLGDGELKFLTMEEAMKFMKEFQGRMDDLMDYKLVLSDINTLRAIALHHPDLLFLADSPTGHKDSLPISTLIDHLCICIDLEDPPIQAAVLKMISYLSFTFKKVLVAYLSKLLSTLFTLYNKASEEDIRRKAFRTLRILAKYSGDLKFMAYILLMPTEMRTRYKKISSKMLEALIIGTPISNDQEENQVKFKEEYDRSNLNIFVLEDSLLSRLIKFSSEWFGDASDEIRQVGESLIGGIYLRFKEQKKGKMFFWWLRKLVRQGEGGELDVEKVAEEYLEHPLNPHYNEKDSYLEGDEKEFIQDQRVGYGGLFKSGISKKRAMLITKYLKQNFGEEVNSDARKRGMFEGNDPKEIGGELENESVFRRSSSNILGLGMKSSRRRENNYSVDGVNEIGFAADFSKRKKAAEFFGGEGGGGKRGRDHQLQDKLMEEIDKLISS